MNTYNVKKNVNSRIELVNEAINQVIEDIENQFSYELNMSDFKQIVAGLKNVIVNQLSKANSRKWQKWQKNVVDNSLYNSDQYYDDWELHLNAMFPDRQKAITTGKVVYQSTYRAPPPLRTLDWDLVITEEVSTFIKKLMFENKHIEWGAAFSWTKDSESKQVIIDKIYIMPVETSGGHVQFINESQYVIFADLSELGEFVSDVMLNEDRYAGMMHSHHSMSAYHSGTDHNNIDSYMNDFGHILSIVWAFNDVSGLRADIIHKSEDSHFKMENQRIVFNQELEVNDMNEIQNDQVDQYNKMVTIVSKDLPKYKKMLEAFTDSNQFLSIQKLFKAYTDEENSCENISILQKILAI